MSVRKIAFGSEEHKRFLTAIQRRWRLSRDKMSERYSIWAKAEDQMQAFLPTSDLDAVRKQARESGLPQYTTIEVPYSYAQLLAAHTYWTSVFLARTPVMQFEGRHGETQDSIQALEAVIDYQLQVGRMLIPLYIWLMDAGKYGCGIIGTYWEKEEAYITEIVEVPKVYMGFAIPGTKQKLQQTRRATTYEGNRLYNIRPYDWFPDPRVPMSLFQTGEFCARYVEVGWNHLKRKEAAGTFYNLEEVKASKPSGWMRDRGSQRIGLPNADGTNFGAAEASQDDINRLDYVELLEMYIELIPSEWGLSTSSYPEKWVFTVANDKVIISAEPLGMLHNQFPFDVIEYEVEGYGLFKRGMPEMIKPLNDVMTWLFNTHFYNVRKVLNDQFLVDPSRIVMKDALDPQPGKLIRLKPSAYGTDPRTAIVQLPVVDVTQNHLRDSSIVADMIMRMTGVNDQIMGMLNSGGRRSATEVRQSSTFGINRLKTNSEYFSAQGWAPLAQKLVQNTQQRMTSEQHYKVAGSLLQRAERFITVTPELIAGFYDFVPVDGTMPVDRYAQAALWQQILAGMRNFPQLMMEYDIPAIFGYVAQLAGLRNLQQFKVQVTPDQALLARMQAGNVVPLKGAGGGTSRRGDSGTGTPPGLAGTPQVTGVGTTG